MVLHQAQSEESVGFRRKSTTKIKAKDAEKVHTSGFGFKYPPVMVYGKIHYWRKDVEHFLKLQQEKTPVVITASQFSDRASA